MLNEFEIDKKVIELSKKVENEIQEQFKKIDEICFHNSLKVLNAFHKHHINEAHFNATTGYGYGDIGRDTIEEVYSTIFKSEDALVRSQFISGTHALTVTLFGLLRPNDTLLSINGKPYDTLDEVIGIVPNDSSLKSFGINYEQIVNGDETMNEKTYRPKIGMMSSRQDGFLKVNHTYINAIWRAGGWCIPLGYTEDPEQLKAYADMCDGFMFSGGVDVDPKYYGESIAYESVEVDAMRDSFEMAMFPLALETGKPIFGICRGIQVMNVCKGGTLYQHIDGHRQETAGTDHKQKLNLTKDVESNNN